MEQFALDFAPQRRHGSIQRLAPWIDDYGPLGVQPIELLADRLADTPFDAVPNHRLAQRAGRRKTDSRSIGLRLANAKGREERARMTGALVIDSSEIFRAQEADTFRKTRDGTATSRN